MAKNPTIHNDGGVHRYIDYVSQIPDFLKAEEDVVVLLQLLSDYLNNAYRNISTVEKFEFKFIAIESNLITVQKKAFALINLFKQSELRSNAVLFLSKPEGNPYISSRPLIMEYIRYYGDVSNISTADGILNSDIITPSIKAVSLNGDKFFVKFTDTSFETYSGVYYYDTASDKLVIDPNSSSQDPFTNTENEPISSVVGLVPRIMQFNVSDISDISSRKESTVNDLVYYGVSFTATISNIKSITSVVDAKGDVDDNVIEDVLIDYYNVITTLPSTYDEDYEITFGAGCDNFDWTYGYGKGLFYARELTQSTVLSNNKNTNYVDPIYGVNSRNIKILDIINLSGSNVTVTVDSNHLLNVGDKVYISDTTLFNGNNLEVTSIITPKQFTYKSYVIGHEYSGELVISDLFYSKLVDSEKYKYKLAYSNVFGENSIVSGDLLNRATPEYDVISTTFNPAIDLDVINQLFIVSNVDGFNYGDYVVATIPVATVSYLSESTQYKIIDIKKSYTGKMGIKLEGIGFTSVGSGSDVTLTKVNKISNDNSFNVTDQTFTFSDTYGLVVGDMLRIIPVSGFSSNMLSESTLYTIESVNTTTNAVKLNGVRFLSAGSSAVFGIVKYTQDLNTGCTIYSHNSQGSTGEMTLSSMYGDVISKGYFLKNSPDSLFPVMIESTSTVIPWVSSTSIIYTKGSYVYYDKKRYRVLKTHTSGNIQISNNEYFIIDMAGVVVYDKKAEYNPYMNGMYSVKSLDVNESPDFSIGFDKLYSDLYIKKIQDLSLKFGHEQRQFIFDPRVAPSNLLTRNGFMEIIQGSGDYDAVTGDISSYINARSIDSMLLRGADWTLISDISVINATDGIVTVKTNQIHHLETGIYVTINNMNEVILNGRHKITVISPYVFSYTIDDLSYIDGTYSTPATAVYNNDIICEIESISRSSTYATVVTTVEHGYRSGMTVHIDGASESGYNGDVIITVIDDVTFTYQVNGLTPTPATTTTQITTTYTPVVGDFISVENQYNTTQNGIYVVDIGDWKLYDTTKISVPVTLFSKQNLFDITTENPSTSTELNPHVIKSLIYTGLSNVLVELYDTHDYSIGSVVTISGASQTGYNGRFEITAIPNSSSFYYRIKGGITPSTPATAQTGLSLLAQAETWYKYEVTDIEWQQKSNYNSSYIGVSVSKISGNGSLITINTSIPNDFSVGDTITISNTANYNGTFNIYSIVNPTTFTIIGGVTSTELNGNVYKGILIESNYNKNNVFNLYGEYKFVFDSGSSYKFSDGDIIELRDQFITRENGIYRVQSNAAWKRLDKKLVLKIRDITVDGRENDEFDELEDNSVPYIYTRFSDAYVNQYIADNFEITHQIYKIDGRFAVNYSFVFEKIDNLDTAAQLHLQYDSRYDYNSVAPRTGMDSSFIGVTDMTYPLIEKFERLAYLKDPKVIDLSIVEYLARFMGYDITEVKSDIDESIVYTTAIERENALRETIQNLPQFYALKGTESSLDMLLLTFGIVGKLVTYWTRQEDPYNELIADYDVRGTQISDNINGNDSNFIPTPHFKIKVEIEGNFDNQLMETDNRRIRNQIHRFKPINTVFDGIYKFLECKAKASINISNMRARGRMTSHVGFDDISFVDEVTNDCFDGSSWNIQSAPYLDSINPESINGLIGSTYTITPVFSDGNVYACEWFSNNETVATVDSNGVVTCLALGYATISCTYQYITFTCEVMMGS